MVFTVLYDIFEVNLGDNARSSFADDFSLMVTNSDKTFVRFNDLLPFLGLNNGLFQCREARLEQRASVPVSLRNA